MENICFFTEEVAFTLPAPAATAAWIQAVVYQEGYVLTHLNFIFCSDRYLHTQNIQYLRHNTLTDVLTFDYADTPGTIEGDIYISIDRVNANAKTWQQPFIQELQTVMVHGVLHLLGYEDQTPAAKALMRQKEAEYVAQKQGLPTIYLSRHSPSKMFIKKTKKPFGSEEHDMGVRESLKEQFDKRKEKATKYRVDDNKNARSTPGSAILNKQANDTTKLI